jgi:hypothetical protein
MIPTGKTGNQWSQDDFGGHDTPLVTKGAPEFVAFCIEQGTCELQGNVVEKLQEIVKKYPLPSPDDESDDDYDARDHFAVVVRDGLIKAKLVPAGDPRRYQYQISMLFIALAD